MALPTQANVLATLKKLTFNDLDAPCGDASYEFEHDLAERRYPYVDGSGHEWTGRQSIRFAARLYFLNTIEPDLYPDKWNQWRDMLLPSGSTGGGEKGVLFHPDIGKITVRLKNCKVDLKAEERSGIVVELSFVETLDETDTEFKSPPAVDLRAVAKSIDADYKLLGLPYPDGIGHPDFFGAVDAFLGQLNQFETSLNGLATTINGKITKVQSWASQAIDLTAGFTIHQAENMQKTVEALNDFRTWPVISKLELSIDKLKDQVKILRSASRPIKGIVLQAPATLDSIADDTKNTIGELIDLNPSLMYAPILPVGTVVTYYNDR